MPFRTKGLRNLWVRSFDLSIINSSWNPVVLINFSISKYQSSVSPYQNLPKFCWSCLTGQTYFMNSEFIYFASKFNSRRCTCKQTKWRLMKIWTQILFVNIWREIINRYANHYATGAVNWFLKIFFSAVNFAVNSLSNKPWLLKHQFLDQLNYFYGPRNSKSVQITISNSNSNSLEMSSI